MTTSGPDFRQTWLWRQAFLTPRSESTTDEQEFFRAAYLSLRDRAAQLVSRIAASMPMLTVHDISHLDALWDMASSVAEGAVSVNPAEAYVLGASILLHDSAMSVSAYPNGLADLKQTLAWKDAMARHAMLAADGAGPEFDLDDPPQLVVQQVLSDVLRRLHAEHAEVLADQAWTDANGTPTFLIEDSELRRFYGPTIGRIAHSHWWPIQSVENELASDLGALATRTRDRVDRVKLACLLRIADAIHLDSRRAPRFLRTLVNPSGISARHWAFQEKLARPHIELDAVVFTAGQPFGKGEAEDWWLAFDTLNAVDRELRDVDQLLQSRGREVLKARRVKGAGSPEILSRSVETRDWRPIDARIQVSDVPRIVETLGGSQLYGNDPTVAIRELIQNSADAVQARRRYEKRPPDWGIVRIGLRSEAGSASLFVEDNGIGMSEQVLTGPLLDFGTSFWRSPLASEEFPGLMAAGMRAIGRFGIGFFSVFMLGKNVRVYSRRCDRGVDTGRLLEFHKGTSSRPILSPFQGEQMPIDGGTRVEISLAVDPKEPGGLLYRDKQFTSDTLALARLIGSIAPNLAVALEVVDDNRSEVVVTPGDWLKISDDKLIRRIHPESERSKESMQKLRGLMQPIVDQKGKIFGRALIEPSRYLWGGSGCITIAGLRSTGLRNIEGILLGEAVTASRQLAHPLAPPEALAEWASKQAELIGNSVEDEEKQALSAEVVLSCGGKIGDLKIIKWGSEWLNSREFEERLRHSEEIAVSFEGEFSYDEDVDDVHPKEFRDDFEISEEIALVFKHDGVIVTDGKYIWPPRASSSNGQPADSCVANHVRQLIRKAWGPDVQEDRDYRTVGKVRHSEISRRIAVFRPGITPETEAPKPEIDW